MTKDGKEFRFEEEARNALSAGIDQLADAVAITLGPRGRSVGLQASWGSPQITSDGYSIAKEIEFKDPFLNMGASLAKEAAAKVKEKAGDGTTTTIVLLRALVAAGVKNIAAGVSPIAIKRGMDKALETLLKELDKMATPIEGETATRQIATVAAAGHAEVGEKIAACFAAVGKEGVISIEEGKGTETIVEQVQGMQCNSGYVSPYFCTNAAKMTVEMNQCLVLITDKKISSAQEILPLLQHVGAAGLELVVIAEEIDGDALSTLVINKIRGTLKIAAVKAPGFGEARKAMLEDIAILTGGEVISEEKGLMLREAGVDLLGRADQVIISKDKITIVGGKGEPNKIKARVAQLEALAKKASSKYDKEKLDERKAKLHGGVAVIKVGAATESEMKKKKQIYEDSLHSTQAALAEGVVPGGGVALLRATQALGKPPASEEGVGMKMLISALEAPFRQIVSNAGFDPSTLLGEVLAAGKNHGFNVSTEKVEDMAKAGILDPAKVVKSSLTHAVSIAGVVLLSEVLIG